MRVYVLGVGSSQGAPIPIPGTGNYMKDNTGNTVMSALNEDMCKQIAAAGGGVYIHVENNSAAQQQLDNELDKLSKKETNTTVPPRAPVLPRRMSRPPGRRPRPAPAG